MDFEFPYGIKTNHYRSGSEIPDKLRHKVSEHMAERFTEWDPKNPLTSDIVKEYLDENETFTDRFSISLILSTDESEVLACCISEANYSYRSAAVTKLASGFKSDFPELYTDPKFENGIVTNLMQVLPELGSFRIIRDVSFSPRLKQIMGDDYRFFSLNTVGQHIKNTEALISTVTPPMEERVLIFATASVSKMRFHFAKVPTIELFFEYSPSNPENLNPTFLFARSKTKHLMDFLTNGFIPEPTVDTSRIVVQY